MAKIKKFFVVGIALQILYAVADTKFYCGLIGVNSAHPIILQITDNQGVLSGQYFDRYHQKILPLTFEKQSQEIIVGHDFLSMPPIALQLFPPNSPNFKNQIEAFNHSRTMMDNFAAEADLVGTWDNNQVKLPVLFYKIDDPYQLGENKLSLDTFLKGVPALTLRFGTTEVKRVPSKTRNFHFNYVITRYRDPSKITALNQMLSFGSEPFLNSLDQGCGDILMQSDPEFNLLTEDLLFINSRQTGYIPGTAHGLNNEGDPVYYDLAKGTKLNPEQIFIDYKKNKQKIVKLFFSNYLQQYTEFIKTAKKDNDGNYIFDDEHQCLYAYVDDNTDYEIAIDQNKKELGLAANFPHAANLCNNDFHYVPTHKIINFLRPDSAIYKFLIKSSFKN